MRNKKGQFFELYLVIFTLFLCVTVIYLSIGQKADEKSSLVSPNEVSYTKYGIELYEFREKELIKEALEEVPGELEFDSSEFRMEFRKIFLEKFNEPDESVNYFIRKDLAVNGQKLDVIPDNFVDGVLYPASGIYSEGDAFIFSRGKVGKVVEMKARNSKDKINFQVTMFYEFDRKYKIDSNFNIEVVD